jgi:hypothetical protein
MNGRGLSQEHSQALELCDETALVAEFDTVLCSFLPYGFVDPA